MLPPIKKRSWRFMTISGKGGGMILPFDVDAETALYECRLSLGNQVIGVE